MTDKIKPIENFSQNFNFLRSIIEKIPPPYNNEEALEFLEALKKNHEDRVEELEHRIEELEDEVEELEDSTSGFETEVYEVCGVAEEEFEEVTVGPGKLIFYTDNLLVADKLQEFINNF